MRCMHNHYPFPFISDPNSFLRSISKSPMYWSAYFRYSVMYNYGWCIFTLHCSLDVWMYIWHILCFHMWMIYFPVCFLFICVCLYIVDFLSENVVKFMSNSNFWYFFFIMHCFVFIKELTWEWYIPHKDHVLQKSKLYCLKKNINNKFFFQRKDPRMLHSL